MELTKTLHFLLQR